MDYLVELKRVISLFPPNSRRNLRHNMWTIRTVVSVRRLKHLHRVIAESFIESNLYMWCELVRSVMAIEVQPFTVEFELEGKMRRYTPDALVLTRLKAFVVECKPAREYFLPEFQAFVVAARAYFASFGLEYVVVDEMDVAGWSLQTNLALLWRAHDSTELLPQAHAIEGWLRDADACEFSGGLTVAECLKRGASIFAVHCALANEQAHADLHKPITVATRLHSLCIEPFCAVLSKLRAQLHPAVLPAPGLPSIWQAAPPLQGRPGHQMRLLESTACSDKARALSAFDAEEVAS